MKEQWFNYSAGFTTTVRVIAYFPMRTADYVSAIPKVKANTDYLKVLYRNRYVYGVMQIILLANIMRTYGRIVWFVCLTRVLDFRH